jgi:hypothetical protein
MMFETRLFGEYECRRDALRLSNTQLSSIAGRSHEGVERATELAQPTHKGSERCLTHRSQ